MDKRELILQRLVVIATGIPGIIKAGRNRGGFSNPERPSAVILDADERTKLQPRSPPKRGGVAPCLVTMRPEVYVLPNERRPINDDLGTAINGLRMLLTKAIMTDAPLRALIGTNGSLTYAGMATDLKSGSLLAGAMRLDFDFTYVFDPSTDAS